MTKQVIWDEYGQHGQAQPYCVAVWWDRVAWSGQRCPRCNAEMGMLGRGLPK